MKRETTSTSQTGPLIRAYRKRLGLTGAELAAAVGASSYSRISNWERGAYTPRDLYLYRLLKVFRCTPKDLDITVDSSFYAPLKQKRFERGLTVEEAAAAMGACNGSLLTKWEIGYSKPSEKWVDRLAAFYQTSAEELGFPKIKSGMTLKERNEHVMANQQLIRWIIKKNATLVRATRLSREDLFQDLEVALIQALNTYVPGKGRSLTSHAVCALQYGLQHSAAKASAGGLAGAPRDLRPAFRSIEAFEEAGFQIAAGITGEAVIV